MCSLLRPYSLQAYLKSEERRIQLSYKLNQLQGAIWGSEGHVKPLPSERQPRFHRCLLLLMRASLVGQRLCLIQHPVPFSVSARIHGRQHYSVSSVSYFFVQNLFLLESKLCCEGILLCPLLSLLDLTSDTQQVLTAYLLNEYMEKRISWPCQYFTLPPSLFVCKGPDCTQGETEPTTPSLPLCLSQNYWPCQQMRVGSPLPRNTYSSFCRTVNPHVVWTS